MNEKSKLLQRNVFPPSRAMYPRQNYSAHVVLPFKER